MFFSQALYALEHGLELWESHYDPDGVEVANAMCQLAQLHLKQGKPRFIFWFLVQYFTKTGVICY